MSRTAGRTLLFGCLAVSILTLSASSAAAGTTTIGQTGVPNTTCSVGDWNGGSGAQYYTPYENGAVNWTIDSWSTYASPLAGQRMKLKVYKAVTSTTSRVTAQDVPRTLTPGVLNTFATNIEVSGFVGLGFTTLTPGIGCAFGPMGETFQVSSGTDTATGDIVNFAYDTGERLNISAQVEPTNTFSLGAITINKKRGTARLTVDKLLNVGVVAAVGKGIKPTSQSIATVPGGITLQIRSRGKAKSQLNRTGKVTVHPQITFSPTDGNQRSVSAKVRLKKL